MHMTKIFCDLCHKDVTDDNKFSFGITVRSFEKKDDQETDDNFNDTYKSYDFCKSCSEVFKSQFKNFLNKEDI